MRDVTCSWKFDMICASRHPNALPPPPGPNIIIMGQTI
jgi:hypothetical protein